MKMIDPAAMSRFVALREAAQKIHRLSPPVRMMEQPPHENRNTASVALEFPTPFVVLNSTVRQTPMRKYDSFQAHRFRQKQPRYQRQSEHYIAQNAHHAERYRRSPFHRSKPAGSAVIRLRSIYMALVLSVAVTCAAFLLYQRALHFFSSAEAAFEPCAP